MDKIFSKKTLGVTLAVMFIITGLNASVSSVRVECNKNKFTISKNDISLTDCFSKGAGEILFDHGPDSATTMLFDYDNDGDMDVAKDNFLYINQDGDFDAIRFVDLNNTIISLPQGGATHADFNNDGYEDLVYGGGNFIMRLFVNTYDEGEPNSWFEMHELFDFKTLSDPNYSPNSYGITSADFNDDGYVDLAVSYRINFEVNKIAIFYNQGGLEFIREDVYIEEHDYEIGGITEVEAGDFDNDDDIDLLYAYNTVKQCYGSLRVYDQTVICILFNDGENNFGDKSVIATRGIPIIVGGRNVLLWRELQHRLGFTRINSKITSADYDMDGDIDFLLGDLSGKVEMFENDGTGHFTSPGRFMRGIIGDFGYTSWGLDSGDFDNDGDIDFIVCGTIDNNWPDARIYLKRNLLK